MESAFAVLSIEQMSSGASLMAVLAARGQFPVLKVVMLRMPSSRPCGQQVSHVEDWGCGIGDIFIWLKDDCWL